MLRRRQWRMGPPRAAMAVSLFTAVGLLGVLTLVFFSPMFPWGPAADQEPRLAALETTVDARFAALESVVQIATPPNPPVATKTTTCAAIAASAYYVEKGARELALQDMADVDTVTMPPTAGQTLGWNATTNRWEPANPPVGPGGGDVVGPLGATPGTLPRFADATGKTLTTSGVAVDAGNAMTGVVQLSVASGGPAPMHNARLQLWGGAASDGLWVRAAGDPGTSPLRVELASSASALVVAPNGAICIGCPSAAWTLDVAGPVNAVAYRIGGALLAINHLADVDTATSPPTEGQVLAWNAAMSHWEPRSDMDVTGIDGLADVDTSTTPPTNGQVLTWIASSARWEPRSDVDVTGLDGLADVDTTTSPPTDGQVLAWNATLGQWVPHSDMDVTGLDGLSDVTLSAPVDGHILRYDGGSSQWINGADAYQGDVVGPASATDRAIALWDGASGKLLQNSALLVSAGGSLTVPAGQTVDGRDVSADGAVLDAHVASTANPHSVTKTQVGLSNVPNLLTNLAAAVAPTATDDSGAGYAVGSPWVDIVTDTVYVCADASVGAAVWRQVSNAGTPAVFGAQYATAISDGAQTISTTTYSQRLRLTTPSLTGGATYRIGWSFEVSRAPDNNYQVRVELDDTTTLGLLDAPPVPLTTSGTGMQSGFTHVSPGAGVHTVDIDTLKSSALGTNGSIRRIRIEIWRVA